jgi:ABC-2 type transport system permease protein
MTSSIRNILTIARREFLWRGRGRTFIVSTIILVVVAMAVALAPIVIRYISERSEPTKIGLYEDGADLTVDVRAALDSLLNGPSMAGTSSGTSSGTGSGGGTAPRPDFTIVPVTDLAAGRSDVGDGRLSALLALGRTSSGDLHFDLYTKAKPFERTPQLIQQTATSLAIQDRLSRLGVAPADQASLFSAPSFAVKAPAEATSGPGAGAKTANEFVGTYLVGFALTIFIFMAIMLYGQWVAMSVAEEKSSRVMEIVLGAATPFQLLAGKVIGVGGLGLVQYLVVFVPVSLVVVFQDRIAAFVLGGTATSGLPPGLTIELLVAFGVMFVLGFALYAVLYAGAASMVSRQEDINQVVAPLTLLSTAGYMVAAYAGTGLLDLASPALVIASYIPFISPYLILTRIAAGQITPPEVILAIGILVATTLGALWVAGRIYAAGVLMYGQSPGIRAMIRAFRGT